MTTKQPLRELVDLVCRVKGMELKEIGPAVKMSSGTISNMLTKEAKGNEIPARTLNLIRKAFPEVFPEERSFRMTTEERLLRLEAHVIVLMEELANLKAKEKKARAETQEERDRITGRQEWDDLTNRAKAVAEQLLNGSSS